HALFGRLIQRAAPQALDGGHRRHFLAAVVLVQHEDRVDEVCRSEYMLSNEAARTLIFAKAAEPVMGELRREGHGDRCEWNCEGMQTAQKNRFLPGFSGHRKET